MARRSRFEVPTDTSLFTPFQLQPKALLSLSMTGWAQWLREHLVSFPKLVKEHRVGVVVVGVSLEYRDPLGFFDTESLEVITGVTVRRGGAFILAEMDFLATGRHAARARYVTRPVIMGDGDAFSAMPGQLPPVLLDKFAADEVSTESLERTVPGLLKSFEPLEPIVSGESHPFILHRHACEVADQWCFIDVPAHAAMSRESIALEHSARVPLIRPALNRPLRRIDAELKRPYYVFDKGTVHSRFYPREQGLAIVHDLRSKTGSGSSHAIVVEQMD